MKKKRLIKTVLCFALSACAAGAFAACESDSGQESSKNTQKELRGFEIEKETDTAELGETYLIENLLPHDTEGKFYDVTVSVEKDGENVTVLGGAFDCSATGEYTITYSLTFEDEELNKTTKLTVQDTVAPVLETESLPDKITQGATVDLSGVTARDWSGVKSIDARVELAGETIAVTENKFTATQGGVYTVTFVAEDNAGNSAESAFYVNCLKKNELYNFESSVSAAEIYGATTQTIVKNLPDGNDTAAMRFTFLKDWQQVVFRDFSADFWRAKESEGYESISFDVYYEGAETNNYAWVTPFGASAQPMKANAWKTFTVPLEQMSGRGLAFNIGGQKNYKVYLDNMILNEKPKEERLYYGFEAMNNDAWKYVEYFYMGVADSTEKAYERTKSMKITPSKTWSFMNLRTGTGVTLLDNAWIQSYAGKTFSMMVYYENTEQPSDSLNVTISNGTAGQTVYSKSIESGKWVNITFKMDDIQSWEKITIQINSQNAASGVVYFDDFKLVSEE